MYQLVCAVLIIASAVKVDGKLWSGYCKTTAGHTCGTGFTCLYVNPKAPYGRCVPDGRVCVKGGASCSKNRKCLTLGITQNKEISVCLGRNKFCKKDADCSTPFDSCLITDKKRTEGMCVKGTCQDVADASDKINCPKGFRCCFTTISSGVCMKGDFKDIIPMCLN